MVELFLSVVIIVGIFGIIIRFYTGSKILVYTFRSAMFRFLAGVIVSFFPLLWWRFRLHEVFETGEIGTMIIAYFLFACCASAIVLIPLGVIQFLGVLFNTSKVIKTADGAPEDEESKGFSLEDKNKCPSCESKRLRKKSTYRDFLTFIGLFIALIIFAWVSYRYNWDVLYMLAYISSPFVFGSIILSGISVAFGKNKCLDCDHRFNSPPLPSV